MKACFQIAECSLSSAKIMQASAMKACFQMPSAAYLLQRYKKIPISANYSWIICANGMKKAR